MKHLVLDRLRALEFGTLRLTCQPVLADDAAFYAELYAQPEIAAHGREDITLQDDLAHWHRHGFGRWMLIHAGQNIGLGGLTVLPGFAGLNLSYHLLPAFWGQGLASEFVRASVDHAREGLASDELFGLVAPSNIASIRVLEKAGFRDAGLHLGTHGPVRELRIAL